MDYNKISQLISSAIALGEVKARSAMIPETKNVKRKQVLSYLKIEGLGAHDLDHWEKTGAIKVIRRGERVPALYNLEEIMKVILMLKTEDFILI